MPLLSNAPKRISLRLPFWSEVIVCLAFSELKLREGIDNALCQPYY